MDFNTAVVEVKKLQDLASKMAADGMQYALIDIEPVSSGKQVNFQAVTGKGAKEAIDYGSLASHIDLEG